jgi:hypothetical protein
MFFNNNSDLKITDRFILNYKDKPIGILQPSLLYKESQTSFSLYGSKGMVEISKDEQSLDSIILLITPGCLITGQEEEIEYVNKLLNGRNSRSISYFLTLFSECSLIINLYERISSTKINIIGCGGIGSTSAVILSEFPFKSITLIDPDIIEETNFNRQLFWRMNDIGYYKVDILEKYLNERECLSTIKTCKKFLSLPEDILDILKESDISILTADSPLGISEIIMNISKHINCKVFSCGYYFDKLVFYDEPKFENFNINLQNINGCIMPSHGPSNIKGAGIVTNLLFQFLSGSEKSFKFQTIIDNTWI